uniref:ATP synthase CF0 subunit I n=1 Tax=Cyperus glomeratus TaxID=1249729 RepID=UPI001F13FC17|nr:ATP synthase CF0 subunit I [Cyperus glomeratus]YP_010292597.1 ATP synthase CF0 subunit I [Cyperus michelianus]ULQ64703.1 ATP synthase CF0 subunit I [Cyperus glomeratus]ULQ64789.1 ATP synthase CF0 subunit I [Cyperus michelianus]
MSEVIEKEPSCLLVLSIRGEHMKNVTDSLIFLGHWPFARSFGFNTDILATNLINLIVVIGILVFFGKGVLNDLLDNRKQRILNTLRNSEELRKAAIEQLEKAQIRFRKVEQEANEYRQNEYSDLEREKQNLIKIGYEKLKQFEKNKNESLCFEQERAINQVRQRILQQVLQRALGTIKSSLNSELHSRTIRANIAILGAIEWEK